MIGSSVEGLPLARALQRHLEHDYETAVWTDGVFRLSQSSVESLVAKLSDVDFAILVVTPDDISESRGKTARIARDNVLFELGLAVGRLGRERAFVVSPRDVPDLKMPSDVLGMTPAQYSWRNAKVANWMVELGGAAEQIRQEVSATARFNTGAVEWGFFSTMAARFRQDILHASDIELYFIHSRRWRENNLDELKAALSTNQASISVYLPNVENPALMAALATHFDDGAYVEAMVREGYGYWARLKRVYGKQISVYQFDTYPTYTFYRFDSDLYIALYPNSIRRTDVPTLRTKVGGSYEQFVRGDLTSLTHRAVGLDRLRRLSRV